MRTKHLFMTMALAAGFAACTSEDVIESSYNNEGSRKILDNITFTVGEGESRFALENGAWAFGENDAFGAALVDAYSSRALGTRGAIDFYTLQSTIQSNYEYVKGENGGWTTPAKLVEGNYVFYAPFNAKHLSRKPIEVITPIAQTLNVNEDGTVDAVSAINNAVAEGNPFFLAYEFLPAVGQETNLALDFYSIFAYPLVTIENNKKEEVTLTKLVVKTGNPFTVKAPLNVGTADAAASASSNGVIGALFNYGTESTTNKYGSWVNKDVKNGLVGATENVLGDATAEADVIVINLSDELTIPAGESVSFNIVMPADTYSNTKLLAYVDDEEGYEISLNTSMQFYPNKHYPVSEYKNNGTINEAKKGDSFTATITKDQPTKELANEFPILVSTTDELKDAIIQGNSKLYVIPTSEDVEINKSVVDLMRQTKFQGMTVAGDIKIIGSTTAADKLVLNEKVSISGMATIVSGYVKTDAEIEFENVTVDEGATLDINDTNEYNVVNNGTVNVDKEEAAVKVTENFGTLNINKKNFAGSIAEGKITDEETEVTTYYGTVNVNAVYEIANEALYSAWNFNADATFGEVSVCGEMTIADGAELEGTTLTVEGGATLNVNGELEGDVLLNGVEDDAETTTVNEYAEATLNLNSTSSLINEFAAADDSYAKANIVNVEDGASFFSMDEPAEDVISWFVYDGNLDEAADVEDVDVPEVCNSLKVDGNIAPKSGERIDLTTLNDGITTLVVDGDIMIKKGAYVAIENDALEVTGDIVIAEQAPYTTPGSVKNLDLTGTEYLKVAGELELGKYADLFTQTIETVELNDLTTEDGLDMSKVTSFEKIIISGKLESKNNINLNRTGITVVLNGAELLMANDARLNMWQCDNVYVGGNVTLDGEAEYLAKTITLLYNASLTIDKNSTLGTSNYKVTFVRSGAKAYDKAETETANGKVYNEGTLNTLSSGTWIVE